MRFVSLSFANKKVGTYEESPESKKRQQGAGARSADAIISKNNCMPAVKVCQEKNAA
jgi:hypothetical protein